MSPKKIRQSRVPAPADVPEAGQPESVKALTVNVPSDTLHRAKTRASLEGTTMSAVVTEALVTYAEGLKHVLGGLGFVEKK